MHGYWRSSAAYRVRIALNLKNRSYEQTPHDLRKGEQRAAEYLALAPHGLVPALEIDGETLIESPAILEYLDERFPDPPLLPKGAAARAHVRAMVALVACDIHPLNNVSILQRLRADLQADEAQVNAWVRAFVARGFAALETLIARHGGHFAFGDAPTLADVVLVPQMYNAERFDCDVSLYPRLAAVVAAARALPAFAAARPELQPDAG